MTRPLRVLPVLLALAGCGHSPPTHFYVLERLPGPPQPGLAGSPVQVNHVVLPEMLDRAYLVTQTSPTRVEVSDQDRWTGPLGDMIQETLAADLQSRLGGAVLAPGDPAPPGTRAIALTIQRFIGDPSGRVVLQADWSLLTGAPPRPRVVRHETIVVQANGTKTPDIVAAMSQALADLADRIARTVSHPIF